MRVLICDDDKIVLTALKGILNADNEIEVVGVACDGLEAIDAFEKLLPDILLMDIRMKNMTGIEAGNIILGKHKDAKIIFLTTFDTDEYILQALKMGAKGYILKQNYESIAVALKMVMLGGRVFGDEIIDKVPIKTEISKDTIINFDLTEREMEVIELVSKGLSNKEIATTLFLSEGTVRNYISTILDKLYLRDRTQLVIFYYKKSSEVNDMFKFKDYPHLLEYHKKYRKFRKISTRELVKIVDYGSFSAEEKFNQIQEERKVLIQVYSKAIFDTFIIAKPKLYNRIADKFEKWDNVIGDNYDNIPENRKVRLTILIEEDGRTYRLPPEYYE